MFPPPPLTYSPHFDYNASKKLGGGTHMQANILVVDDEPEIADLVEVYL